MNVPTRLIIDADVSAVKEMKDSERAAAAAAADAAHAEKLCREAAEEEARLEEAARRANDKKAAGSAAADPADEEVHMTIERIKKGDASVTPHVGDKVSITYTGTFADGTHFEGTE